jgi:hypothetical protein
MAVVSAASLPVCEDELHPDQHDLIQAHFDPSALGNTLPRRAPTGHITATELEAVHLFPAKAWVEQLEEARRTNASVVLCPPVPTIEWSRRLRNASFHTRVQLPLDDVAAQKVEFCIPMDKFRERFVKCSVGSCNARSGPKSHAPLCHQLVVLQITLESAVLDTRAVSKSIPWAVWLTSSEAVLPMLRGAEQEPAQVQSREWITHAHPWTEVFPANAVPKPDSSGKVVVQASMDTPKTLVLHPNTLVDRPRTLFQQPENLRHLEMLNLVLHDWPRHTHHFASSGNTVWVERPSVKEKETAPNWLSYALVRRAATTLPENAEQTTDSNKVYLGWAENDFKKHFKLIAEQVMHGHSLIGTCPSDSLRLSAAPLDPVAWARECEAVRALMPKGRQVSAMVLECVLGFTVAVV